MKKKLALVFKVALMLGIIIISITFLYKQESDTYILNNRTVLQFDSVISSSYFYNKSAKEGLKEALEFYAIEHPDIVYAQVLLETGHFNSTLCLRNNNLFGLYDSRNKKFHKFNHWIESVIAYKKWIQRRYEPPENYYNFLKRIHYASDSTYISKLKQIVKKEHDKKRYTKGDTISKRI